MPTLKVGDRKKPFLTRTAPGFTLLEAVLVILVLGLIAALVTPAFTSSYRGAVLKSTVRSTAANLRYVRATAISTGTNRVLAVNSKEKYFSVLSASPHSPAHSIPPYINIYEPSAESVRVENLEEEILFEFSPNGGSNGGNLVFAYENLRYLIEVSPLTGKVIVSRAKISDSSNNLLGYKQ